MSTVRNRKPQKSTSSGGNSPLVKGNIKDKNENWTRDLLNWNNSEIDNIQSINKLTVLLYSTVIVLSISVVYALTQYPTISGGDAGELIINAYQGGIAHPPGYPLFTMLGYLFCKATNFLHQFTVAWKVSLMSSIIGSFCGVFIYLTILLWVNSHNCGLAAAYMFSFSPLIWMYSIQGEVFSMNNMFVAAVLFMGVWYSRVRIFEQQDDKNLQAFWNSYRVAYTSAFVCGLGLTNQHTLILIIVPFVLWIMLVAGRDKLWTIKSLISLSVSAILGLSPYLYLFISPNFGKTEYSWGNTSTIDGFITHFLRKEYGTLQLYSGESGTTTLSDRINLYFWNQFEQFTIIGVILAALGFVYMLVGPNLKSFKWRSMGTLVLVTFIFYITFFFNLCNLPIEKPLYKGVFLRFFMQPNVIVSIAIGLGLNFISTYLPSRKQVLPFIVYTLIAYQSAANFKIQDQSKNEYFHDFGHAILDQLPKNAILLVGGDLVTNVPQYLHLCEKVRPDVDIISLETMSWDWFTKTQRSIIHRVKFPGEVYHPYKPEGFSLKTFLDVNQNRPIHVSGDFKFGDNSFQKDYFTVFSGFSSKIISETKRKSTDIFDLVQKAYKIYPEFPLPDDIVKYPNDSWEYFLITDVVINLEKGIENLLSNYLKIENDTGDKALKLASEMLTKVLSLRPQKCWSLKHLGITYDHLRYRLSRNASSNTQADFSKYSELLNSNWRLYIQHCYNERDSDWEVIKQVAEKPI
ncbi:transmembrane protein [Tieghemostelium lacteum]|uniref:Transmembrane protein n=1 Tax=Tieghemostelium lacteum TaxID=361077 RepID=A0A152A2W8_TIELA|nr:transmembrane protein [Tieghemostelium lacteum]|eukprot:KYR00576.1 transmembrane protein [Tieghemostelium lacteum]